MAIQIRIDKKLNSQTIASIAEIEYKSMYFEQADIWDDEMLLPLHLFSQVTRQFTGDE
jgi:hypothetical protein